MILSMLRIDVRGGRLAELAEVFRRHRILETAIQVPGCHTLLLTSPPATAPESAGVAGAAVEPGNTAYVLGLWDDEAAYQRWIDHPERGAANDDLRRLASGDFRPADPAPLWTVHRAVSAADPATTTPHRPADREDHP